MGGVVAWSSRLKSIRPKVTWLLLSFSRPFTAPISLLSLSLLLPSVLTMRNCSSLFPSHYICSVLFIYLSTQRTHTPSRLLDTSAFHCFFLKRLMHQSNKNKNQDNDQITLYSSLFLCVCKTHFFYLVCDICMYLCVYNTHIT